MLVIGSEGFIGKHVVTYFKNKGWDVHGCGLRDAHDPGYSYHLVDANRTCYASVLQTTGFDVCINAGGSGNVAGSIKHPARDFQLNVSDTQMLLEALREHGQSCKYLHISSAAVYGDPAVVPIKENSTLSPVSPYGWHKLLAEQLCKEYHEIYKLRIVIARPFSVYGPGLRKQLFWDLFQKYQQEPAHVEVSGTGKESRDFIHIKDVLKAFELLIENAPMQAESYNIGSGIETEIAEVVNLFFHAVDKTTRVSFNRNVREGDPLKWRADISRLSSIGFKPQVGLREGIEDLTRWLKLSSQSVIQ